MATGKIVVNFSIDSTYAEGKDKAVACPDPGVFCAVINTKVFDDNGQLRGSSCHMAWRLFHGDSPDVFEKGRGDCGDSLYVGRTPMEAGPYRVEVDIEMDDGTKGSGLYRFEMLPQ